MFMEYTGWVLVPTPKAAGAPMPEVQGLPENTETIHIMGVGGTAMAALAGMLVDAGFTVTGSDGNKVYPPMSDYLASIGIEPMEGFEACNLDHQPDLVIVGNVVRSTYEEAKAVRERDLPYMSFPSLIGSHFLEGKRSIVVAGTHGKTTTSAIAAWLLEAAGRDPGFLVGGVMANFDRTAKAPIKEHFVIEGDEYDTAYFDKGPKFLHYRPTTAILTSIEFDHADIYRDLAHCQESFRKLMGIMPADGCVVARMDHEAVAEVVAGAECEVRRYGPNQAWDGRIDSVDTTRGIMRFTVLHEGKTWGTFDSGMVGEHNLYNQVAIVAALDREGLSPAELAKGFESFKGIRRRQEIRGEPGGVTVIDDFAHHPTAVQLTLEALRLRFGGRRLWAIFEPRSNTSRRNVFQDAYAAAFDTADIAVIASPFDQSGIDEADRMNPTQLVEDIRRRGNEAFNWPDADAIAARVSANVQPEDVVAILSNGGFGGLHGNLIDMIERRFSKAK
jgi:UDP-N-acetylmuramate: L-alanyl-gamma-D-glutamyl-meso-diaminopimelate ligase